MLGGDSIEEEWNAKADHSSANTRHHAREDIQELRNISRRLRGGADHRDLIDDIQNIMQAQLENVQSMQKMYQDGDVKGLSDAVKSIIGDGTALIEASKDDDAKSSQVSFPVEELDLTAIHELNDIPDSQIAEFFQPQMVEDIAVQMQDVVAVLKDVKSVLHTSSVSQRRLKSNLFGEKQNEHEPFQFDQDPFKFGANGKNSAPWDFLRSQNIMQKPQMLGRSRLPDISKFVHQGNDANSVNRRLKVNERHNRRLQDMLVCQPTCASDDATCNCDRLLGCVDDMSDYDIALLFVGRYIDNDPTSENFADFIADVNLYDADFNITQRIKSIRTHASSRDCSLLLPELHTACDPSNDSSCSDPNDRSFQLSIEDVCDAVNNPTKLLLTSISGELDGYWGEDGMCLHLCEFFVTSIRITINILGSVFLKSS